MHTTKLTLAALVIVACAVTSASAQVVKPFEELEGARRDRVNKARWEAAGRARDAATATGAR